MRYHKILALAIPLFLIGHTLSAQTTSKDLEFRKWRITLINPISTNGTQTGNYTAKYSINLIGGIHGGLGRNGREIGGLFNINTEYASGVQLAGLFNYTRGYMEGASFAGIANISTDDLSGLSAAGIGNFAYGNIEGLQASGIINAAKGDISGLQASGFANIAGGYVEGLQAAGFINYAGEGISGLQASTTANITMGDMEGLLATGGINFAKGQISGLVAAGAFNVAHDIEGLTFAGIGNISTSLSGLQIGTFNFVSGSAEGMQIGLINFAKEFDGAPIGVLSVYGNGRYNMDVRYSDAGFTDIAITTGTHRVYNMAMIGYNTSLNREVYRIGFAVGIEKNIQDSFENWKSSTVFTNKEFSVYHQFEGDWNKKLNFIYSYKYLIGKRFGNGASIYGGPTINMQVTRVNQASDYTWYSVWSPTRKGRQYRFWVGLTAGVRLFKQKNMELTTNDWNGLSVDW